MKRRLQPFLTVSVECEFRVSGISQKQHPEIASGISGVCGRSCGFGVIDCESSNTGTVVW